VFSSAKRESAYVIDGLMHNQMVKSDIHSIDAFGFSELIFAVSHLLGFAYAAALQKSRALEALYFQESQRVRPFRLEDQARRLCR
jgi:TnpA family transposase